MTHRITILGCGSSGGVPRVGGGWGACDPDNPRNRRRRCSILIERMGTEGTTRVLVDTSPDLREQLLDAEVRALDAVILTHEHADHTHGIDDLRPLCIHMRRRLDLYQDAKTSALMRERFGYCFETPPGSSYPPIVQDKRIAADTSFSIPGSGPAIELTPMRLVHGDIDALGLRFADIAYSPDVSAIPEASIASFAGLRLWIIDALRFTPHPTHFHLDEALGWIARMKPERAILTNLHTDLDYDDLRKRLPDGIDVAYDGLSVEL
jgi:phosphoribosyl 1,2-cyclic phosphate phosphodiesterase